jgi:hypothetical protein
MRTIDDYMNTPEIAKEPMFLREIHAARLMLQDETAGMSVQEKCDYLNNKERESLARHGITPEFVNLSGEGKLRPRVTV